MFTFTFDCLKKEGINLHNILWVLLQSEESQNTKKQVIFAFHRSTYSKFQTKSSVSAITVMWAWIYPHHNILYYIILLQINSKLEQPFIYSFSRIFSSKSLTALVSLFSFTKARNSRDQFLCLAFTG